MHKKSLQAKFKYVDFTKLFLKNFIGHNLCLISYLRKVLESRIPEKKCYNLRFLGFRLFYEQIFAWNLKLPSKTEKLPSKMQIITLQLQLPWLNYVRDNSQPPPSLLIGKKLIWIF